MPTVIRGDAPVLGHLIRDLRNLWEYRDLFVTLTLHRVKVRYKQSVLGISWAVLQPLSLMLIYTLMFTLILPSPTQTVAYPIFVYSALLPWTYFSNAINSATNSIVGHSSLVTKVYFPREILPLTYIGAALLDLLIAATVMAALMMFYGVAITAQLLLVLPILFVLTLFVTAIALFLSAAQARVRDVGVAIALVLQLWMFASPVIYPLASVPVRLRSWYVLNPMVGIIGNFRASVLGTGAYDWQAFSIATLASILLLPIAYVYFKRVELSVADVL